MRVLGCAALVLVACATPSAIPPVTAAPPASSPAPAPANDDVCPTTAPPAREGQPPFGALIARVCLVGADDADFLRLNEALAPREGTPLDAAAVQEDFETLVASGSVKDVVALAEPLAGERVRLTWVVSAHARVGAVRLEGPTALTRDEVDEVAKVGLPASPLMLRAVSGALEAVAQRQGYPYAHVEARLEHHEPGLATLVLSVKDGPRLVLGAIAFAGVKQVPTGELRKVIASASGAPYSAQRVAADLTALTQLYFDRGLINAKVTAEPPREANGALELTFTVVEGDAFRVGTVKIKGDALGKAGPLLASLKTRPGAIFSRALVRDDLDRLQALGQQRGLELLVTPLTEVNATRKRVDLTFELEPQR